MKKKQIIIRLDESLAYDFKVICTILKRSQNDVIDELIHEYVERMYKHDEKDDSKIERYREDEILS